MHPPDQIWNDVSMVRIGFAVSDRPPFTLADTKLPGILRVGSNTSLSAGDALSVDANRPSGSNHDELDVTGTVDIFGASLAITTATPLLFFTSAVTIENDDSDVVTSMFAEIPGAQLLLERTTISTVD